MHIVHVIARLNDGGPARVIEQLVLALAPLGFRATVLAGATALDEPDLSDRLRAAGVAVETLPALGRKLRLDEDVRAFRQLMRRLRALAPDVVHTHTAKAGAIGRVACRVLGLPCLHTYHGHVLDGYFRPAANAAARLAERICAGTAHHQALTPTQLLDLRERFGVGRHGRWHCLPPPVAPVTRRGAQWHARLQPGVPVVGLLGRLAPVKDAGLFIDALVELRRRQPVQGVICGDGGERPALEERARQSGVPVVFTGFVPAGEALGAMDVLAITSRNEGLPLVAVEAGSVGVPVVGSAVGGVRDLIRWGAVRGAE
ncbi:MAG: glycosyltransferase family 4 protein, partial [Planctomycetes bacterium]|nr:glycosyltransferase family 4 protein [Planctomycetota bacterium]